MKLFGGWMFPDHETHLIEWLSKINETVDGRLRYQGKKQDIALQWCRHKRVAVDIGAHVGLWSYYLAKQFQVVHSFEPVADHRECFGRNVQASHVVLYPIALGEREGSISMHTSTGSSGDSWISGEGEIPLRKLDDFDLHDVDLIKLDCEGGELPALRGAERTLLRCHPAVIVEQKPGHAQKYDLPELGALDYLRSLGAHMRAAKAGDFVFAWD